MIVETINEPAKVRADFRGGVITPLAFKRKDRTFRIKRVHARWMDREGRLRQHCFSVETDEGVFELTFNADDMTWRIARVYLDG